MFFTATATINASPETVWKVITDASAYTTFDPGVARFEGTIAPGNKLTVYTKRDPNRAFPSTVTEFIPNQKMTWTGGMPLGLFKGVRTFTLTPKGDNQTELTIREDYSGLLSGMITRSIPDLSGDFQNTVQGVKKHAENM